MTSATQAAPALVYLMGAPANGLGEISAVLGRRNFRERRVNGDMLVDPLPEDLAAVVMFCAGMPSPTNTSFTASARRSESPML